MWGVNCPGARHLLEKLPSPQCLCTSEFPSCCWYVSPACCCVICTGLYQFRNSEVFKYKCLRLYPKIIIISIFILYYIILCKKEYMTKKLIDEYELWGLKLNVKKN